MQKMKRKPIRVWPEKFHWLLIRRLWAISIFPLREQGEEAAGGAGGANGSRLLRHDKEFYGFSLLGEN